MRALVTQAFRDREHMERTYWEGDEFDGSAERVRDLEKRGYVTAIEEAKTEDEPSPKARKPRTRAKKAQE